MYQSYPMDIDALDLNLLKLFDAVWQERHVGRAARRLMLTQPAASNGLARLRLALKDTLFVKTPGGMVPTARAEELAPVVAAALETLRVALRTPAQFDPAGTDGSLCIGLSDHAEYLLAPSLACRLAVEAPRLTLRLRHADRTDVLGLLDQQQMDLAIGVLPEGPSHMTRQILHRDPFTVLSARPGPATLEDYCLADHLLVSAAGAARGAIDLLLDEAGLHRRIALTVAHYGVVPAVLRSRPMLLTLPGRLAARLAADHGLVTTPLPPGLNPGPVPLSMLWHGRAEADPLHRWVRRLIAELARGSN
jgi:DNA-binding transcriptional LysR family regulator